MEDGQPCRMAEFIVGILIGGGTSGGYISTMISGLFIKTWLGRQVVGTKFDFGKTTGLGRTAIWNRNILSSSLLVSSRMI